jgi:hypothetical protein
VAVGANDLRFYKGEDFTPQFILGCQILSVAIAVGGVSVVTTATPHGFATGDTVWILGVTGSSPAVDNTSTGYVVTVLSATTFSIALNVTVAGAFGICNNVAGDITSWTIQVFVKTVDTSASIFITVSCTIVGSPSMTFKAPFTSVQTQTAVVGTVYVYEARRTDSGFNWVLSQGNFTPLTERQFQTP